MSRAAGRDAEQRAAAWLIDRGFQLLETNYTCKGGEIDLVCDDAGTLVFVEVRARSRADYGSPLETISAEKRRRIILAARHYLVARGVDERARPCRFDAIAVEDGAITHVANAFEVTGG